MKIISNIFYSLFILLLLGVAGLFLVPLLPIDNNIEIKIVESGSMEPAIMTGSLVVVVPQKSYQLNDVITFKSTSADVPTTHRIVNIEDKEGTLWFTTKGDANEEADNAVTPASAVLGKVLLTAPYAGFILDFARQPIGFVLLIVLPALMIVLGEIEKIWKEIRKKKQPIEQKEELKEEIVTSGEPEDGRLHKSFIRMMDIESPVRYAMHDVHKNTLVVPRFTPASVSNQLTHSRQTREWATSFVIVLISVFFASLSFIGSTVSYFNDTESSLQNLLQATALDFTAEANQEAYTFIGTELIDGAVITVSPVLGSTDVQYDVNANLVGASTLFCDSILVTTGLPLEYSGLLINLNGSAVVFAEPWTLSFSLPPEPGPFAPGETCTIEIIYTAWQANGNIGEGYSDEEIVTLVFTAPETFEAPLIEPLMFFAPESFVDEIVEEEIPETEEIEEPIEDELPEGEQINDDVESVEGEEEEEVEETEEEEEVEEAGVEETEELEVEEVEVVETV